MNRICKMPLALITAIALVTACGVPAWAEGPGETAIDEFDISISYDTFQAGDDADESDITVTVNGISYVLEEKQMLTKPKDYWKSGTVPRFRVVLEAKDGYYFSTKCTKLSDAEAWVGGSVEVTGISRGTSDHTYLYITMNLDEVEGDDPDPPESGPGSVPTYEASGPGTTNPNEGRTNGAWLHNDNGWWFVNPDGTQTRNGWQLIDGKWYWFNQYGYMLANNWVLYKNKWYFCGPNGDMYVYRYTPDGYWVDVNGEWVQSH